MQVLICSVLPALLAAQMSFAAADNLHEIGSLTADPAVSGLKDSQPQAEPLPCSAADNGRGYGLYFPSGSSIYRHLHSTTVEAMENADRSEWCRAPTFLDLCLSYRDQPYGTQLSLVTLSRFTTQTFPWTEEGVPDEQQCRKAFAELRNKKAITSCFSARFGEHIPDLAVFAGLDQLESLCAEFHSFTDVAALSALRRLKHIDFDVTLSSITDSTPLTVLPDLEFVRIKGMDCGVIPEVAWCSSDTRP